MQKIEIENKKVERKELIFIKNLIVPIMIGIIVFFAYGGFVKSLIAIIASFSLIKLAFYLKKKIDEAAKVRKMEEIFPDFIELMASNLRAGMTVDRALLLSSRKEFSPLDKEILALGKDILTGKEITSALNAMSLRIKSEKITKTVDLINSGIKSGGNLSILLEDTAVSMRERLFIEKKASSNVIMYVIFIFFATVVGAPMLFALSSILVEIMTKILSTATLDSDVTSSVPFSLSKINISTKFITYYSITFLIVSNIFASLMLGLTNKGEEKEGLKYLIPMLVIGIIIFFIIKIVMLKYFSTMLD